GGEQRDLHVEAAGLALSADLISLDQPGHDRNKHQAERPAGKGLKASEYPKEQTKRPISRGVGYDTWFKPSLADAKEIGLTTLPPGGGGPIFRWLGRNDRNDESGGIENGVEAWIAPAMQRLAGRPVPAAFGEAHGIGRVGDDTPIGRRHHSKDGCR